MSHYPSENINILICSSNISYYYNCWKKLCCLIFLWKYCELFGPLEGSKEQWNTEIFCNILNIKNVFNLKKKSYWPQTTLGSGSEGAEEALKITHIYSFYCHWSYLCTYICIWCSSAYFKTLTWHVLCFKFRFESIRGPVKLHSQAWHVAWMQPSWWLENTPAFHIKHSLFK